ncbi:MAG: hydrogenase expression/formation protein HypE [Bacteroidales bacterium]
MSETITLNHGSGYKLTHDLIGNLFAQAFRMSLPLTDSAVLKEDGFFLAFTTDSYVVDPLFFPGGDIGKLSICGTVNDLAVSGAIPGYISVSFIIEEGFPFMDLRRVVVSMAEEAIQAGVSIVTGDTKVVEKGKCDKLYITTSGTGIIAPQFEPLSSGRNVQSGDSLIINGPVGNHAVAILGARKKLSFHSPVISDCASLNHMIRNVLNSCSEIRFMRDLTRGGLAAVLNELADMTRFGITINEESIPVDDPVRGLCEILGFDPLYLANEGKVLIVAGEKERDKVLDILRNDPRGKDAALIGEITSEKRGVVILNTLTGGKRVLDMPSGLQLPRIC